MTLPDMSAQVLADSFVDFKWVFETLCMHAAACRMLYTAVWLIQQSRWGALCSAEFRTRSHSSDVKDSHKRVCTSASSEPSQEMVAPDQHH